MRKKRLENNFGALLQRVRPDELEFDSDNPRFGGGATAKSQKDIEQMLLESPHFASELVDSLVENGFIEYEPLVVRKKGSKYVVIEGNRRLAAVRYVRAHLEKFPDRKDNLEKIPVLVFPKQETAKEKKHVRAYLGVRHLIGIREWPPLSKAQFLDRESRSLGGLDNVLKEVRLTKTQARRFLIPFRLLKRAKIPLPEGEDFWMLAEALGRSGVKNFLGLEVNTDTLSILAFKKTSLNRILNDLYGPKMPGSKKRNPAKRKVMDTRELSLYSKVLNSEKARNVLHGGKELEEAAIYVDTTEQSVARLRKLVREVEALIAKVAPSLPNGKELRRALASLALVLNRATR